MTLSSSTAKRLGLWLIVLSFAVSVVAASRPGRAEILGLVYPGGEIKADRVVLTPEQAARVAELSGEELPSKLVARYRALQNDREIGRAYVDTHIVRTKKESLLICLDGEGRVRRIEVTAFLEPPEYEASEPWYGQYEQKQLDEDLRIDRAIRALAGATLTARATNSAVRRILAIDAVLTENVEVRR